MYINLRRGRLSQQETEGRSYKLLRKNIDTSDEKWSKPQNKQRQKAKIRWGGKNVFLCSTYWVDKTQKHTSANCWNALGYLLPLVKV